MESQERITEWRAEHTRLLKKYPLEPKVVYLASSYRSARGEYGTDEYIYEAKDWARKLWKAGLAVICPAANTGHMNGYDVPDMVWMLGDFSFIRRCDGLVVHPNACDEASGAVTSRGVNAEIEVAHDAGVPVFYLPDQYGKLCAWAKNGTVPNGEAKASHWLIQLLIKAGCELWQTIKEVVTV